MSRTTLDLWVGFFVAVGLGALLFLALKVGNMATSSSGDTYAIHAKFDNIGGLKVRGAVKSAGVVVGRVTEISFDPEAYQALVTINVDSRYKFPRDTF
ncbi:MAG: MlaD family protein, partial [Sulfuritalea sp.]|nr:MlaD family protein [Sulfuritalea sp.]